MSIVDEMGHEERWREFFMSVREQYEEQLDPGTRYPDFEAALEYYEGCNVPPKTTLSDKERGR